MNTLIVYLSLMNIYFLHLVTNKLHKLHQCTLFELNIRHKLCVDYLKFQSFTEKE